MSENPNSFKQTVAAILLACFTCTGLTDFIIKTERSIYGTNQGMNFN